MTLSRPWSVLFFLFFAMVHAAGASEYYTLAEFQRLHPEEIPKGGAFDKIVQQRGIPVATNTRKRPVRIAFIYPGRQASDYWRRSVAAFRGRMDEIGVHSEISQLFSKPAVDYRVQEKQIKQALEQDPDFLVFTLDVFRHRRIIEQIISRQRPRLILQNITTPLKAWEGRHPFLYVGFDHARGSRLIADYFIRHAGETGEYAVLYFSRGYVSAMRGDTFISYLSSVCPALRLSAAYYTDGNRLKSRQAALEILRSDPLPRFIYACATDVALGAVDALYLNAPPDRDRTVMLNGWGGGGSELAAIGKGRMDVTVMRMNDDNGVAMAEAIRLAVQGKADQVPRVYSGSFALVDNGIAPSRLQDLKRRAFRYSGLPSPGETQ